MAEYPSSNDREFDLLKKIVTNTAAGSGSPTFTDITLEAGGTIDSAGTLAPAGAGGAAAYGDGGAYFGTGAGLYFSDSALFSGTPDVAMFRDSAGVLRIENGLSSLRDLSLRNLTATGNITTNAVGKTLLVKSGANSKAGTFTLASGVVTVSNTSITANSVVVASVKTSSGTLGLYAPLIVINAATGFSVTGAVTDNSTYNYIVMEVN